MTKEQQEIARDLGKIIGRLDGIDGRLKGMTGEISKLREYHEDNGKELVAINARCAERGQDLVDMRAAIDGLQENTGLHRMAEIRQDERLKTTWLAIKIACGAIMGLAATYAALWQALK